MSDWTEDQIKSADPDELSEAIARRRTELNIDTYRWPDHPLSQDRPDEVRDKPQPYATEWWAAGPLLEELQTSDADYGLAKNDLLGGWECGPTNPYEGYIEGKGVSDTAPLAIARAWLLAYERGLLEVGDE